MEYSWKLSYLAYPEEHASYHFWLEKKATRLWGLLKFGLQSMSLDPKRLLFFIRCTMSCCMEESTVLLEHKLVFSSMHALVLCH